MKDFITVTASGVILMISVFSVAVLLMLPFDISSCKQKAEAYNLNYKYKFPAGCLSTTKTESNAHEVTQIKLNIEE